MMRRLTWVGVIACLSVFAGAAFGQSAKGADARRQPGHRLLAPLGGAPHTAPVLREFAQGEMSQHEVALLDRVTILKIVNFLIFAGGLAWAIARYSPRFFNARSSDIQKAIQDATGLKLEADYRYSEIDRKMASLAEEVRRMRAEAQRELEREHERFRQESQAEIDHIHHNVVNEIDALRKQGVNQVRRHTAQLALGVAERRLIDRFRGPESDEAIHDFVNLVERSKN